ncbi:hypothetical protein N7445_006146 [Penicillium cf. griseofulvum]|nr:hypothetical protein N7445_006146 [Penicillium cf. griseofulvum]
MTRPLAHRGRSWRHVYQSPRTTPFTATRVLGRPCLVPGPLIDRCLFVPSRRRAPPSFTLSHPPSGGELKMAPLLTLTPARDLLENASDSDSSTVPSVFDLSSESESESKEESEDKLASEDKEERPSLLISPSSDRNAIARKLKRDWIRRNIFRIEETVRFLKALFS